MGGTERGEAKNARSADLPADGKEGHMLSSHRFLLGILIILTVICRPAAAQEPGSINGRVMDAQQYPLSGAVVD